MMLYCYSVLYITYINIIIFVQEVVKMKTKKWDKKKQSEYYKSWRAKNKEKIKEYQKKWHAENKEHVKQYIEENSIKIKEQQKEYRDKNKDKIKEMWNNWYKNNPERSPRRRFTESKNKAIKLRRINWELTFEEYTSLIFLPCYYCNNELGEPVKRSCGLDRLDSNIGYILSNVVSCCSLCNTIKNDRLTPEETKIAVTAILNYRKNKLQ